MVDAVNNIGNGLSNIFRGIGNISTVIGDGFLNASAQVAQIPGNAQTDMMRMYYNGVGFWTPWWLGVGYPINFGSSSSLFCDSACKCGCNGGSSTGTGTGTSGAGTAVGGGDSAMSTVNTMNSLMDVSGINLNNNVTSPLIPIYNPEFASQYAFSGLDRILNPGNYNSDGTKKAAAKMDAKDRPMDLVDPATGQTTTPLWYNAIASKKEKNEKITAEENKWYQKYNKLYRTYSPYVLDENLNPKMGADGQPIKGTLHGELMQLQAMIEHKDHSSIENYINSCSPEKLAAIELHYNSAGMKAFTKGKALREAIKDACIDTWIPMEWTGYNTDRCKRIFDKMDTAAMESPANMKFALQQALENHRIWGMGFDEPRLCKLLKQMQDNKVFRTYVKDEYVGLIPDIEKKWFKNEETKNLLREIFI